MSKIPNVYSIKYKVELGDRIETKTADYVNYINYFACTPIEKDIFTSNMTQHIEFVEQKNYKIYRQAYNKCDYYTTCFGCHGCDIVNLEIVSIKLKR